MRLPLYLSVPLLIFIAPLPVAANTEKTIFSAPDARPIPLAHPTLADLNLPVLMPLPQNASQLRTHLAAAAAAGIPGLTNNPGTDLDEDGSHQDGDKAGNNAPSMFDTWMLLDNLTPGQRYEVRICWAATDPTNFAVTAYDLPTVFSTPALISSLADYANTLPPTSSPASPSTDERSASVMFLRISAAADYVTSSAISSANRDPVLVLADVILDPFVYNIVPRSLLPTIAYLAIVAPLTLLLGRALAVWMMGCAAEVNEEKTKKEQ
ncbi:hypothetical protein CFIMG_008702RA00001 [Ceratocystis fimbriata CBS 114723]|uniref:Uncharacterized protein n=1 Tax=Ceratocystis fimbriata CBS 114723 TaxID=1035309 RepID=A0A2C5X0M4_9PEZI|nr:hypothetical protein CFIMG_008702RA00001 [Ceratocystis fimbriata CBS 114723]